MYSQSVTCLFIFFLMPFVILKISMLMYSKMSVFSSRAYNFYVLKNSSLSQCHGKLHCVFSYEIFRVLRSTFRPITHLGLRFLCGVKWRFNLIFSI